MKKQKKSFKLREVGLTLTQTRKFIDDIANMNLSDILEINVLDMEKPLEKSLELVKSEIQNNLLLLPYLKSRVAYLKRTKHFILDIIEKMKSNIPRPDDFLHKIFNGKGTKDEQLRYIFDTYYFFGKRCCDFIDNYLSMEESQLDATPIGLNDTKTTKPLYNPLKDENSTENKIDLNLWNDKGKSLFEYLIDNYNKAKGRQKYINIYHFLKNTDKVNERTEIGFHYSVVEYKKLIMSLKKCEWTKTNKPANFQNQLVILNNHYSQWVKGFK